MAGIGFELRRVFKKRTVLSVIKGFTSSAFISSGPMIINILLIVILDKLLISAQIPMYSRETIKATIMYAFVFSMINASGFLMIISRFISDKLFIKDTKDILSSLIGIIAITIISGSILSFIFFIGSTLTNRLKLISYIIFIELSILYILMAYISAVKEYKRVALSYLSGAFVTVCVSLLVYFMGFDIVIGILFSVSLGYFINIILLIFAVKEYFTELSSNVFSFFPYFQKHYLLFFANLFYTSSLFIHNILFWRLSNLSTNILGTYYFAPAYDTATFFAMLTTIPAAIIFIVKFETFFYEKYKSFLDNIVEGGSLKSLQKSKKSMVATLKRELTFITEIQFIITIILSILGANIIMPIFANDTIAIELFVFLCFGFFLSYMSFINIIILIYFDIKKEAMLIALIFLVTNIIFSLLTINLGGEYYGLGYDASSLITYITSVIFLNKEINRIDYRLYSK